MYNNFVVEGEKIVAEILRVPSIEIENLVCTPEWETNNGDLIDDIREKVLIAKERDMDRISGLKTASDVLVVVRQFETNYSIEKVNEGLSLYLDKIQNPGNLGTILRIADWFGISTVFTSPDSADLYNPKVIQSTMGAFLRVQVIKLEFESLIKNFPELPVYGTLLEGESVFETKLSKKGIIVIGSEGKGISDHVKSFIQYPINIPAHSDGGAESLNAAVATGIVCAAFRNIN